MEIEAIEPGVNQWSILPADKARYSALFASLKPHEGHVLGTLFGGVGVGVVVVDFF